MSSHHTTRRSTIRRASRERGVVLLFSLIALVIMLIAAVALIRSFNSSLFSAGNIGFKRDMRNQSELAVNTALGYFRTLGPLSTTTARSLTVQGSNYSAVMLPSNPQSIPNDLVLSDSAFAAKYTAGDLSSTDPNMKVTIRYLIDRLCSATGDETTLGAGSCVLANNPTPAGGGALDLINAGRGGECATCAAAAPLGVVYRLSIKVTGPRNTQSFFQSTFTAPS